MALAFIVFRFVDSSLEFVTWLSVSAGLLLGGPALFVGVAYCTGQQADITLRNRHNRIAPLILASLGALVGAFLVINRQLDHSLLLISYILVADLIALTFVTIFWKISIHTTTLTALITLLIIFRGPFFALCFIILPFVCWARFQLRRHTLAQLIAGSLLGVGLTLLTAQIFR